MIHQTKGRKIDIIGIGKVGSKIIEKEWKKYWIHANHDQQNNGTYPVTAPTSPPPSQPSPDDVRYDVPDDCHFTKIQSLQGDEDRVGVMGGESSLSLSSKDKSGNVMDISLTCNLRTVNSEFDTTNFTVIPSDHTVGLRIVCNDDIMARSKLLPNGLAHLHKLKELSVDYCKLAEFHRLTLTGLDNLRNLTIRTHNINWASLNLNLDVDAFLPTKKLERLDISKNNIWTLPDNVFCHMNDLNYLNVSENRLQDVGELGFREKQDAVNSSETTVSTVNATMSPSPTTVATTPTPIVKSTTVKVKPSCSMDIEILDASHNNFVLLPSKGIYLQNNTISVLSPKLFWDLEQLQALDLSRNQITSTWIDKNTFKGLIRLVLLNLSHNRINKLNAEIFSDLYTLQILNLRYNQIEQLTDGTFSPMNNLHTLLLSHNKLKVLDGNSLKGLYVLSLLSIDNNVLTDIHESAFRNCSSLQDLNLNGNKLKGIPNALKDMMMLRTVDLGENQISSFNPDKSWFNGLNNLYGLRLIENTLEHIPKNAFKYLPSLQILNLAKNRIRSVEPGAFVSANPGNIQAIRLDGNHLETLVGLFDDMQTLLWLNVSDNKLREFDFSHIPSTLQWLDLHKNDIPDMTNVQNIDTTKLRIQTLDVSFNLLTHITPSTIPDSIELLVDLYANHITTLDMKALRIHGGDDEEIGIDDNLVQLQQQQHHQQQHRINIDDQSNNHYSHNHRPLPEFYIGGNPFLCDCTIDWLQKINQQPGRQYPRVMDLDTIYCKLLQTRQMTYIPLVEAEPTRHFLCKYKTHCFALCHCCDFDACDCEMTCPNNCTCYHDQSWSTNIVECSTLENRLTHIPENVPMDTTEVYIDGNNIMDLNGRSFIGRKNLQILYANNSHIRTINNSTFTGLKRLSVLHLEDNLVEEIHGTEFNSLDNLRELYLQNNHIYHIANASFTNLRKLEIIRLDGNRLVHFEVWHLSSNPYLSEIGLAENMWSCECSYLSKFRNYIQKNADRVIDANRVACIYNNLTSILKDKNGTKCTLREDISTYVHSGNIEDLLPLLLSAACAFVGFFGMILGVFCYRHEIRMWMRSLYGRTTSNYLENFGDKQMLYDAYIIYGINDDGFVNQILANTLENDIGYRLCLHYRDTNANAYITDAVIEAVDSSKTVRDIDGDLRYYLRMNTCIEWDDKKFWQKLRLALPYIRPLSKRDSSVNIFASDGVAEQLDYAVGARQHHPHHHQHAHTLSFKKPYDYAAAANYATLNDCSGMNMKRHCQNTFEKGSSLPCKYNTLSEKVTAAATGGRNNKVAAEDTANAAITQINDLSLKSHHYHHHQRQHMSLYHHPPPPPPHHIHPEYATVASPPPNYPIDVCGTLSNYNHFKCDKKILEHKEHNNSSCSSGAGTVSGTKASNSNPISVSGIFNNFDKNNMEADTDKSSERVGECDNEDIK
uniref:Uncharacterized protein n=1 Tax=Megaselia scalaris TaxID=36166 RepID=T1GVK5_MEGSC